MAPCTHPGMKRLFCLKAKNGPGRFAPSALPHYEEAFLPTSREVNEARGVLILAADRVRSKKKSTKKSAPRKAHHETRTSPATATTSRRRAKNHVRRVSPCSPASIDSGFVEIGLVQLWPSVKTTNVTHTLTHTDRQIE